MRQWNIICDKFRQIWLPIFWIVLMTFISSNLLQLTRSSHWRCSLRKGVLRKFTKFTGKHLCQNLFFYKVTDLPATLLKKRLWHRCFLRNFYEHLFYRAHLGDCFWLTYIRLPIHFLYIYIYKIRAYHIYSTSSDREPLMWNYGVCFMTYNTIFIFCFAICLCIIRRHLFWFCCRLLLCLY